MLLICAHKKAIKTRTYRFYIGLADIITYRTYIISSPISFVSARSRKDRYLCLELFAEFHLSRLQLV